MDRETADPFLIATAKGQVAVGKAASVDAALSEMAEQEARRAESGLPGWHVGAIATRARWQTGHGAEPAGNWGVRTSDGVLLDSCAPPGDVGTFHVNRLPGAGG